MTVNAGQHTHRPTTIAGQQVCQDCHQVLIKPILSFDDERLAANGQPSTLWIDAVKSLCPKPIDFLWIELSERLGCPFPDYIDKLSDKYGGENPPHTDAGPYAWRDF